MSDAELPRRNPPGVASDSGELANNAHPQRRDLHESLLLALATLWLLDAVLQIQRCMFTPGSSGLSGMC